MAFKLLLVLKIDPYASREDVLSFRQKILLGGLTS
jgi:hypothetical protein